MGRRHPGEVCKACLAFWAVQRKDFCSVIALRSESPCNATASIKQSSNQSAFRDKAQVFGSQSVRNQIRPARTAQSGQPMRSNFPACRSPESAGMASSHTSRTHSNRRTSAAERCGIACIRRTTDMHQWAWSRSSGSRNPGRSVPTQAPRRSLRGPRQSRWIAGVLGCSSKRIDVGPGIVEDDRSLSLVEVDFRIADTRNLRSYP